jgi:hypothetical protein
MQLHEYRDQEVYIRIVPAPMPVTKSQMVGYKFKSKCLGEGGIIEDTNGDFHDIKKVEPVNMINNNN